MDFADRTLYGNELPVWLAAGGVALTVFLAMSGLSRFLHHRATAHARAGIDADGARADAAVIAAQVLEGTRWPLLLVLALFLGSLVLTLPDQTGRPVDGAALLAFLLQALLWGNRFIAAWVERYHRRQLAEDAGTATTIATLGFVARLTLYTAVSLLALDNFGIQITALVAGLGIGGIAVALAAQSVLGDLFASLAITLDKPFVLGDFIIVGEDMGAVERIGLKTTHVRSLWGEQIIFSNQDLLNSRIRNYGRMQERRVVFAIDVVYQASYEQLEAIPGMFRAIVEAQERTRFDRAHFKEYGDSALRYEIVYYVLDSDYTVYMDIQQAINLDIFRRFGEAGIKFAYPTRTVYVQGEPSG